MWKPVDHLSVEEKSRIVLAVLAAEFTMSEAARRNSVSVNAVTRWRDRFVDVGTSALGEKLPGPSGKSGSVDERRLRLENQQLKLALAEATVQVRIWRKGSEYVDQVPSPTSRP